MSEGSASDREGRGRVQLDEAKAGRATDDVVNRHDWDRTLRRLERLVRRVPFDQRALRVRVWRRDATYEARAVLVIPAGTLVGHGEGPDGDRALDDAISWLALDLRSRNESARRDALELRRRARERDVSAAGAFLVLDHSLADDAAFIDLFRPLLRCVRDHTHRELVMAQLDGSIETGAVTVSDVLDEVLVRAWSRFADRPRDWPLDEWMVALVHDVVDEYSSEYAAEPRPRQPGTRTTTGPALDEATSARYSAGPGWLAEGEPYWGVPEPLAVDDLLPGTEPSEILLGLGRAAEERVLLDLLADMPRTRRRALTLSSLEGYTDEEISRIQDRLVEDVRSDLIAARERLRDRVTDAA